jgi:hypothetical protein
MRNHLKWLAAGFAGAALAACGGGGSPDTVTMQSVGTTRGTMTKTSATLITVNGVTFDLSAALVRIDDRIATATQLRSGMTVRVRGSDDRSRGRASEVEAENEVRGAVTAVSANTTPQFFSIGDVKVVIDSATIFDDLVPPSFAAIEVGVFVEVNGRRDAAGDIVAARVEGKGVRDPGAPEVDELRGKIAAVNAGANPFTIATVVVSFTSTTMFTPGPRCSAASLMPGLEVEVHGAFTAADAFAATRIDCQDLEDQDMRAVNGEHSSIEGFVANLDTAAHTFTVDGQLVGYSATTEFRDGALADLVYNARVEVEGTVNGTTLVVREIEFEHAH